ALALGTCSESFELVMDYGRITAADTNAFCGARLGNGFDTVTFSQLETLDFRSFGGVTAGVIELPLVKHVPRYAFASATLYGAVLEQAEVLDAESMSGVKAVKLTDAAKEIAANAFDPETYVHAPETLTALELCENIQRCQEPLVMRLNTKTLLLSQHEYGTFTVTAMGDGLTYQWYRLNGETAEPLADETKAVFSPESGRISETGYRCIVTDTAGKTEQFDVKAIISGGHARAELLPETPLFPDGTETGFYQLTVPESGEWYLESAGEAPMNGQLTDEAGRLCGTFVLQPDHSASLKANLTAGQTYYLTALPRWQCCCSLLLTQTHSGKTLLADCTVTLLPAAFGSFDADWHPPLRVVSPAGEELKENTDYAVRITQRNMHYQLDLFGLGAYQGSVTVRTDVIDRVPADTPIPVSLSGKSDYATVLFIPEETGDYYFYGSVDPQYGQEYASYLRSGMMRGQRYTNVSAVCVVSGKPDGGGTVYATSSYSSQNDGQFCGTVRMNAGQMYYLTCAIREERDAAFSLVISDRLRDIREADLSGSFFAVYEDGMIYEPKIRLKYGDGLLTEGEDYLVLHSGNEVPGSAKLLLVGTGLFIGRVERSYEIVFPMQDTPEMTMPLGETTAVSCETQKYQTVWFRAERAENSYTNARYRILNEQTSGGALQYQVYRLDEALNTLSVMQAMPDDKNDYLLKNGLYCVSVSRKYAERGGVANITVVEPYALTEAEMTVSDAVYTGGKVEAPVTLTMPDGTVLQQGRDYIVAYSEDDANIMFGEVPFTIRPTKYSYGSGAGSYQIKVQLPEVEPPELTAGEHAVPLTLDNRLAWFRMTSEDDAEYLLVSDDIPDIVLRVFTPECDMTDQCAGTGTKAMTFYVPEGDTRYIMVKYNGLRREGTLHFRLETQQKALAACECTANPVEWTGEPVKPDITIRDGDNVLMEGVDYEQRYIINDTDIGTASVNYIGKGKYVGMLDVDFPITLPPDAFKDIAFEREMDYPVKPLMLDYEYEVRNNEDNRYLIYSYYSELDADIMLSVYDARCKLSVQMYGWGGDYLGDAFFSKKGELIAEVAERNCVMFLFSATDISSSNQQWKMQLTDLTNTDLKIVEDTENGVLYRVNEDNYYAEAYRIIPGRSLYRFEYSIHVAEYQSCKVEHYQPGIFAEIPKSAVVTASPSRNLTRYSSYYHFLFLPLPYSARMLIQVRGDLNMDDEVTEADAVLLSAVLAEHPAIEADWVSFDADMDENGVLDSTDLMMLFELIEWPAKAVPIAPFWYRQWEYDSYLEM
ncbi:MAG: dockerin type I repeat-containing protein, partial [Oscillospiraceae bacterium]|nr:dockerin type I repeat-containing protein [Oscillospiraceae bacterium]